MLEFRCPLCSAPLRVRDKSLMGRPFACPDCHQNLLLELIDGTPRARVAILEKPEPLAVRRPPTSRTSTVVAGVAAVVLVLLILGVVWSLPARGRHDRSIVDESFPQQPADVPASPVAPLANEPRHVVEQRLHGIHQLVADYVRLHGTYPAPPENSNGFGWIAELARTGLPEIPADFRQPWNSPGNDDFVRRRFPAFENPELPRQPGNDGLPATQFVGVSGVGPNADRLPKTDPRAGIFGTGRATELEDIKDGLAHTMMVAGVRDQWGSWARRDRATVRGFEQAPYVNGPDGFGTGQEDGMFVLMADGSVRFVNRETDPVVVRRLAAMADGLSLDPAEPGDPLTMRTAAVVEPGKVKPPGIEDAPLTVELAEDRPAFNLEQRLAQKIVTYRLKNATPLKSLLSELEELLGVPFETSQVPSESLETPVTAEFEGGTVRDLLTELFQAAEVRFESGPDHLVLLPK